MKSESEVLSNLKAIKTTPGQNTDIPRRVRLAFALADAATFKAGGSWSFVCLRVGVCIALCHSSRHHKDATIPHYNNTALELRRRRLDLSQIRTRQTKPVCHCTALERLTRTSRCK